MPHQEEPVASPRYISGYLSISRYLHLHVRRLAVTGNVIDRHLAVLVQNRRHHTNRSLALMFARSYVAHVSQCRDQADRAVTAHPQVANVVKEDDSHCATGIY